MKLIFLLCLLASSLLASDKPPSPYIDKGACPFECCTYRDWQVLKTTTVYAEPERKHPIWKLGKGTWVKALTGETHSQPVRIIANFDSSLNNIHKGDVLYVLHYSGEGYWKVWVKGRVVDEQLDLSIPAPITDWWAKVRLKDGRIGWVLVRNNFGNMDRCA